MGRDRRRWAVVSFAVLIAIGAWLISYSTQVGVALRHGFGVLQGGGWPVVTEAAALAVMLLLVMGEVRRGLPTVFAWLIVAVCLGITTWINWLADPGDSVAAVMHSWTPVLSVAVFLLLVHGRPEPAKTSVERATPPGSAKARPSRPRVVPNGKRVSQADIEAARERLSAQGVMPTNGRIADELKVSERTVYRALSG